MIEDFLVNTVAPTGSYKYAAMLVKSLKVCSTGSVMAWYMIVAWPLVWLCAALRVMHTA